MESIRTIRDVEAPRQDRTKAAYVLWIWCTVSGADKSLREIEEIYAEIADHGYSIGAKTWLRYVVEKQETQYHLAQIAGLSDLFLQRRYLELGSSSFAEAASDHIEQTGWFGNSNKAKLGKKEWYSHMPFIWAAHESKLPFLRNFPQRRTGEKRRKSPSALHLDLFAEKAGKSKIDDQLIETFLRHLHWALIVWPKSLDATQLNELFGNFTPLAPHRIQNLAKQKQVRSRYKALNAQMTKNSNRGI